MQDHLTVGEAAKRLKRSPSAVTMAIYRRPDEFGDCPMVGGRRMIPEERLKDLRRILAKGRRQKAKA